MIVVKNVNNIRTKEDLIEYVEKNIYAYVSHYVPQNDYTQQEINMLKENGIIATNLIYCESKACYNSPTHYIYDLDTQNIYVIGNMYNLLNM